jgi:sulfate permease
MLEGIYVLVAIAIFFACFFAMNIGASGTAASMGSAYGAGAIKTRTMAVILVGVVALIGAIIGGGQVTTTVSSGIVPQNIISETIAILIIVSSGVVLFFSNKMGIPLSTSEVTIGSIIGVGLVFQKIHVWNVLGIVLVWFILPIISFFVAKGLGMAARWLEERWLDRFIGNLWYKRSLVIFLVFFGCYEAFAAGMNNVANAIGPLVAAGILDSHNGIWIGAIFMCLGAIMLGGPVLETNGKRITKLSLLQGSIVSFTSGSLVIVASLFGIPVPLTQATTMSIIGIGSTQSKKGIWKHPLVRRIILVWVLSPLLAMMTSSSLVQLFVFYSPYPFMLLLFSLLLVILYKTSKVGDIINVLKK